MTTALGKVDKAKKLNWIKSYEESKDKIGE